jgi:hypothetical protein
LLLNDNFSFGNDILLQLCVGSKLLLVYGIICSWFGRNCCQMSGWSNILMSKMQIKVKQKTASTNRRRDTSSFCDATRSLLWNIRMILLNIRRRPKSWRDVSNLLTALASIIFASFCVYKIIDAFVHWYFRPMYSSRAEANFRRNRFPSIEDRVRVYMSNWYLPPCDKNGKVVFELKKNVTILDDDKNSLTNINNYYYTISELESHDFRTDQRILSISKNVEVRRIFFLDAKELDKCSQQPSLSIRFYCSNSVESILLEAKVAIGWNDNLPILCQFSDETESLVYDISGVLQSNPRIPHIKKIRLSLSSDEIDRLTQAEKITDEITHLSEYGKCISGVRLPPSGLNDLQPIIWLLNIKRHFLATRMVRRWDQKFESKKDLAVFRGSLTGTEYNENATDAVNCRNLIRCDVVYRYANSTLVDAKLTSTSNRTAEIFRGVNLTSSSMKQKELLSYKGIIVLEGNGMYSLS